MGCRGHQPTDLQSSSFNEGTSPTHIHPPSSSTNMTRPISSSNMTLPSVYPRRIEPGISSVQNDPCPTADWSGPNPDISLSRPRDSSLHDPTPQANLRAPPFSLPLSPPSDDTKPAAAQDDQAAAALLPASTTKVQTSTPTSNPTKIRNPRRTRRFMCWMRKKFTPPWSLVSPHDPSHGKNAAKRAEDQGL